MRMGNGELGIGNWELGIENWEFLPFLPGLPGLPIPYSLFPISFELNKIRLTL
ncbi:MAG: hypothetical protein F6K47_10430 [Symploca sp. SIO2E6]|nr:hypothetical protein [Symploca sp. SIO2E6]